MIGRIEELSLLESKYKSDKFEFGIVYGSRRIGKTTILDEFKKRTNGFMYQAKNASFSNNLSSFSRDVRKYLGYNDKLIYESFEDLLDDLLKNNNKEKLVLIIDEFSYLCEGSKALISTIQDYVDHQFKDNKILLILSGSNISFMKDLMEDKTNPLYKRHSFEMQITKMKFSESLGFFNKSNNIDKTNYLSLFSTHPYYLAMINENMSFEENVKELIFTRFSVLLDAPNEVLPQGVSNNQIFNSILYQISKGDRTPKDLSISLKLDTNYLSTYLKQLNKMEVLDKKEIFNGSKKTVYYVIRDNFLRFYYSFIFNQTELIRLGAGINYYLSIKEQINLFISKSFENIVIDYMTERNINGKLSDFYGIIKNYQVDNSKLNRSIEIDGIASSLKPNSNKLLVIECKYRDKDISLEVLNHLKESVSIFEKYKEVDYYLFSKMGFANNIKNINDNHVHLISLDDMYYR